MESRILTSPVSAGAWEFSTVPPAWREGAQRNGAAGARAGRHARPRARGRGSRARAPRGPAEPLPHRPGVLHVFALRQRQRRHVALHGRVDQQGRILLAAMLALRTVALAAMLAFGFSVAFLPALRLFRLVAVLPFLTGLTFAFGGAALVMERLFERVGITVAP